MSLEKHVLQLSNFSRTLGTTSLAHWNQRQSEAIKCYSVFARASWDRFAVSPSHSLLQDKHSNDCPGQQVIDDFIQISFPTVSFESFNKDFYSCPYCKYFIFLSLWLSIFLWHPCKGIFWRQHFSILFSSVNRKNLSLNNTISSGQKYLPKKWC